MTHPEVASSSFLESWQIHECGRSSDLLPSLDVFPCDEAQWL